MSSFKLILTDLKFKSNEIDNISLYIHHDSGSRKHISYSMLFKNIDVVCLHIEKLLKVYGHLNYFGLYTKHVLCFPAIIAR